MGTDWVIGMGSMAITVPALVYGVWLVMHVDPKIKQRGRLFLVLGTGSQVVGCVLTGNDIMAAVNAATTAWNLYDWWNNGGGDGMKRRMKKMAGYLGFGPQAQPQGA